MRRKRNLLLNYYQHWPSLTSFLQLRTQLDVCTANAGVSLSSGTGLLPTRRKEKHERLWRDSLLYGALPLQMARFHAFGRADAVNITKIFQIVCYCWNEIPAVCWGSYEKVDEWLKGQDEQATR